MKNKPNITFIGIGLMGSQMAARLLDAGYPLTVCNRSADKLKTLITKGAIGTQSVAEATRDADIIFTCLAGADAVETVYFGKNGIINHAQKNCLTVDLSSISPDIARNNHERLKKNNLRHLDAPVTGGVSGAEAGTLSILVGGHREDLEEVRLPLSILGTPFYLGNAGAGQVCKLVNQAIVHVFIGAVSEGMMLAAASEIDATIVRESLMGGYCQSKVLDIHGAKIAERNFIPGGPLEFSVKDLEAVNQIATSKGLNLPLTQSVLSDYEQLVNAGKGRCDHSGLILAYEKNNPHIKVSPNQKDKIP